MNKVEITRTINAPIEKVWKAWTDAKQLKAWHSPESMHNKETTAEVVEGGAYAITMVTPSGDETVRGIYKTIDPMKKLVFTWKWDGGQMGRKDTTVTVEFKANGNKTDLKLIHEGFENESVADNHNTGWISTINNLEEFLNS